MPVVGAAMFRPGPPGKVGRKGSESGMHDVSDLLDRAKHGAVSQVELEWTAQSLADPAGRIDKYTLIHILGLAGSAAIYEDLVAGFLHAPDDPMLSRMALLSVSSWNLMDKYMPELLAFCRGVEWDDEEDVRAVALTLAGNLLASKVNCDLLEILIETAKHGTESASARRLSLDALAVATGSPRSTLLPLTVDVDLEGSWATSVLSRSGRLLVRSCGKRSA
ncbi:hypothetical protein [Micromonospora sp. WMMD736]|uniref:hypothetical protein n=1 Tax=Micromonospora sp. WMMD736 TaxID=3404112 RepID=UPI003B9577CF